MKKQIQKFLKVFFLSGIGFSALTATSKYLKGQEFDVWNTVLDFSFFGLFMGLTSLYTYKNREQRIETEQEDQSKINYRTGVPLGTLFSGDNKITRSESTAPTIKH